MKSKPPKTASAPKRRLHGVVGAWRRLKPSEIVRAGDRPIYAGGVRSRSSILESEIGMMADETGYYGVARKRKCPNVELSHADET